MTGIMIERQAQDFSSYAGLALAGKHLHEWMPRRIQPFSPEIPCQIMASNEKMLMAIFEAMAESISTILNVAQDLPTEKLVWSD